jgi:hypothetical protein
VYQEKESARIAQQLAQEAERQRRLQPPFRGDKDESPAADSQPAPALPDEVAGVAGRSRDAKAQRSEPGTGYGDRRTEPAVRVAFDAEARPSSKMFLKYEWRETLCRKRIVDCREPANRFWPDDALSFSPPPPRQTQ